MDANDLYLIVQALRQEIGLENTASDTSKLRGSSQFSKNVQDINLGTGLTMVGNTLNASGGGLSDGDKGDITVSLGGTVWTIDNGVVTYAKIQAASGSSKLIGSPSTGTTYQEITLGSGLSMVGGVLSATGGGGTVTSVSVATANGVSGSVANATTTPVITITLGAITPSSVAATGNVTGLNLSGTNTGDQTITLTGDVTGSGTGSFAATIANNVVSNAKLATVATATFKGRTSAGPGSVEDLTTAQATALLDVFTDLLKGLVPASGGGTANFLRSDGSWAAPPSGVTINQSYGFTAAY